MISVIMPVYNAGKYLKKSIESVMEQTYPAWELILVDNGSEDDSFSICQSYAKNEERIFVLHQYQNKGVSAARNLGLEKASGELVAFLDADDWLAPDHLERLWEIQKRTGADMVVGEYQKVYDKDRENAEQNAEQKQEFTEKSYASREYLQKCLLEGYTHCWGVLYTKASLEGLRFPTGMSIGEDVLFLIDAVQQAEYIVITQYSGYRYFINEKGTMMKKFTPSYMDQILCWQKAKEKLVNICPETEDKVNSILVVSAMLVAGKMAALSRAEQKIFTKEFGECRQLIQQYGSRKEVRKLLPSGYAVKVRLFKISPTLYLRLYGLWKNRSV